jgi:hypothetical protein
MYKYYSTICLIDFEPTNQITLETFFPVTIHTADHEVPVFTELSLCPVASGPLQKWMSMATLTLQSTNTIRAAVTSVRSTKNIHTVMCTPMQFTLEHCR